MEQAINSFSGGLQSDAHPMVQGNDVLSDALNATFVTMNGNEVILQNDMGNRRVDNAFLPKGYVPVGMKEYGGVIYVASYNPITDMSLLGSFPSPQKKAGNVDNIPETVINFDNFLKEEDGNYSVRTDTLLNVLTPNNSLRVGDKFYILSNSTLNDLLGYISNGIISLQLGILNSKNEFIDITDSSKKLNYVLKDNESNTPILDPNLGILDPNLGEYVLYNYKMFRKPRLGESYSIGGTSVTEFNVLKLYKVNKTYIFKYVGKNNGHYLKLDNGIYKMSRKVTVLGPPQGTKIDWKTIGDYDIEESLVFLKGLVAIGSRFGENPYIETITYIKLDFYSKGSGIVSLPFFSLSPETIDSLTISDEEFLLKRQSLNMDTYSSKLVSPLYIKSKLNYPSNVRYGISVSGNDLIINATYTTESNYNFPIDVIVKDLDGNILTTETDNNGNEIIKPKESLDSTKSSLVGENQYLVTYSLYIKDLSTKKLITITLKPKLYHNDLFKLEDIYLKHLEYTTTIDIADAAVFKLLSWGYNNTPLKLDEDESENPELYRKFRIKYLISSNVNIMLRIPKDNPIDSNVEKLSIGGENTPEGTILEDTIEINILNSKFETLNKNEFYNIQLRYKLSNTNVTTESSPIVESGFIIAETLKYYNSNLFDKNYKKLENLYEFEGGDYDTKTDSTKYIEDYRTIGKIIVTPEIGYYFNESLTNTSLLTLKDLQTKSYETFDGVLEGYSIPSESFYLKSEGTFNFISGFSIKNTNNYPKSFINSIKIKNITYSTLDLDPNPGTLDVEIESYGLNQLTLKITKTDKITGSTEEVQSNYAELKDFSSLFDENNIGNYIVDGWFACLGYWHTPNEWQFKLGMSAEMAFDGSSSDTLNNLNVNLLFNSLTDKNASMYRTNVYLFTLSGVDYYNVDTIGYILDKVFLGTNSNKLFIRAAENADLIMIADESDILIPQWWKSLMDKRGMSFKTLKQYPTYAAIWMKYGEGKYYPIIIYPCAIYTKLLGKYAGNDFFNKTVDGIDYAEEIKKDILTFLSTKINRVGFFDPTSRIKKYTYYLSGTVTPQTLSKLKITFPVILSLEGEDENFKVNTSMKTSVTLGIYQIKSPKNLLDYLYIPPSEANENLKGLWNGKEYNISKLYYKLNNSLYSLYNTGNVTYKSIGDNLQLPNDLALQYKTFYRTKDSSKRLDKYTYIDYNDPLNVPVPNSYYYYYYPHPGVIILEDLDGGYSNDTVTLFKERTGRRFIFNAVPSFTL